MKKICSYFFVGILISVSSLCEAAMIGTDHFTYNTGATLNNLGNDDGIAPQSTGWGETNDWTQNGTGATITNGLTYSPLSTDGNAAETRGNSSGGFRNLGTNVSTGTVYVRFLVERTWASGGFGGLSFYDNNIEEIFFGQMTGNSYWGAQAVDANNQLTTWRITNNITMLLVGKYDFSSNSASLYINPAPGEIEPETPDAGFVLSGSQPSQINRIRIQSGNASSLSFSWDEVVVGTSWLDVLDVVQSIVAIPDSLSIPEGSNASFQVKLALQPAATTTVTVTRISGDADISISAGSTLLYTTGNWANAQTVTLAAAEDIDRSSDSATIRCTATGFEDKDVMTTEADNDVISIIVNTNALSIAEGNTGAFQVKLAEQPDSTSTVVVNRASGRGTICVSAGSNLVYTTGNWGTFKTVTLEAPEDSDTSDRSVSFSCSGPFYLVSTNVLATEIDNDPAYRFLDDYSSDTLDNYKLHAQQTNVYTLTITNETLKGTKDSGGVFPSYITGLCLLKTNVFDTTGRDIFTIEADIDVDMAVVNDQPVLVFLAGTNEFSDGRLEGFGIQLFPSTDDEWKLYEYRMADSYDETSLSTIGPCTNSGIYHIEVIVDRSDGIPAFDITINTPDSTVLSNSFIYSGAIIGGEKIGWRMRHELDGTDSYFDNLSVDMENGDPPCGLLFIIR